MINFSIMSKLDILLKLLLLFSISNSSIFLQALLISFFFNINNSKTFSYL